MPRIAFVVSLTAVAFVAVAVASCSFTVDVAPLDNQVCPAGEKACVDRCVSVADPTTGCGLASSCAPCAPANAIASCSSAGQCDISFCAGGYGNCNSNSIDGCEINLDIDPSHCGGCGSRCPTPVNGVAGCVAGSCTLRACAAGFGNCDEIAVNGCETNLRTGPTNCGACGTTCASGETCETTGSTTGCVPGSPDAGGS